MRLSYRSTKLIKVQSGLLGTIYYGFFLLIGIYVVGFTILYEKGYQAYDILTGSTMIKIKGAAYSQSGTSRTVYDTYDLVPALEPNSAFITTRFFVTPNQTRGTCEGNSHVNELCDCNLGSTELCCADGDVSWNGVKTGKCGPSGQFCELQAWCPLENDDDLDEAVGLGQVVDFSTFIRTNVRFPAFNVTMTNANEALVPGRNLWTLGEMIAACGNGNDFDDIKNTGAIIVAGFHYDCDLNKDVKKCQPEISFTRLDKSAGDAISTGFNYRYMTHSTDDSRTLHKVYGVSLLVEVTGRAGRFSIVALSLTLGAGMAFLGMASVLTDIIMQYVLPHKALYRKHKYESVWPEEEASDPLLGGEQQADYGSH